MVPDIISSAGIDSGEWEWVGKHSPLYPDMYRMDYLSEETHDDNTPTKESTPKKLMPMWLKATLFGTSVILGFSMIKYALKKSASSDLSYYSRIVAWMSNLNYKHKSDASFDCMFNN